MGITPSGLTERPAIRQEDLPYLDGYRFLTRSRAFGEYGPLPISMTDVLAYLELVKEDGVDERLRFLRYVQDMDGVYLEHAAKLAEASTSK